MKQNVYLPEFIDCANISYSSSNPASYSKEVVVFSHMFNYLTFEVAVRTQNTVANDIVSVTGNLSLQESDNQTTGFQDIPTNRIFYGPNNGQIDLKENIGGGIYITQTSMIGAHRDKRYLKLILNVNASRTDGLSPKVFIASVYKKDMDLLPIENPVKKII